ncbi:MAG: hypothetical protein Tsb009_13750 [Planctomycetaceae bacterium]
MNHIPYEKSKIQSQFFHSKLQWCFGFSVIFLTGCSLFVMAGKMIYGDPKVTCAFTKQTGVNLAEERKKVVVLCTFPELSRGEYSSVGADIVENVTLRLKREGIVVVKSKKVYDWLDDRNGIWSDPDELAEAFDADYIVHIDLEEFTHRADNSPGMYQGRTVGNVYAYKIVENEDGEKRADSVLASEFKSVYPPNNPVSVSKKSENTFLREYVDRISEQLAQYFYNHTVSSTIF